MKFCIFFTGFILFALSSCSDREIEEPKDEISVNQKKDSLNYNGKTERIEDGSVSETIDPTKPDRPK